MHCEHTTAVAPRPSTEVRKITQPLPRADSPRRSGRGRFRAPSFLISLLLHGAALGGAWFLAAPAAQPPIREAAILGAAICESTCDLDYEAELLEPTLEPVEIAADFEFEEPRETWEPPEILEEEPELELPEEPSLRPHAELPVDPAALLSAPRRPTKPKTTSLAFRPPAADAPSESAPMTQTRRARPKQPRPRARPSGSSPRKGLRVTYAPDPRRYYPADALRRGIEGSALVGFVVDARGSVTRAWIETSSGDDGLDRAALALIHAYRFEPLGEARRTRKPVYFQMAASAPQHTSHRRSR